MRWWLAKMNLAIQGIGVEIADGDSFQNDCHSDLKADYSLADPPFNVSDWGGVRYVANRRWCHGSPPKGSANLAWVTHMALQPAPKDVAVFVLANGFISSSQPEEREIRETWLRRSWSTGWLPCRANSSTRPRFPHTCGPWRGRATGMGRSRSLT